jgi:membrane protease YdiL (CAAX protease family)
MDPLVVGGLAVSLGGPPAARRVSGQRGLPYGASETFRDDLLKWLMTGVLLAFVLFVEGESLASVGVSRPSPVPLPGGVDGLAGVLLWWLGGVVATIVLSTVAYNLYRHHGLRTQDEFAAEQAARPLPAFLFTAVTAGVTESVLYQGYPIERLAAASGSLAAAAVASWVAFTAVHYLSGRFSVEATVFTSVPALVVTALYALSGSLYAVVLVHSTVNVLSFLSR